MKIEYDPQRDLLYIWFGNPGERAASTEIVVPGVHADLNSEGRLVGLEVLDAAEVLRNRVQFEVELSPSALQGVAS